MGVVLIAPINSEDGPVVNADTTDWLCPSCSTNRSVFWVKHVACCSTGRSKHCWSILIRSAPDSVAWQEICHFCDWQGFSGPRNLHFHARSDQIKRCRLSSHNVRNCQRQKIEKNRSN